MPFIAFCLFYAEIWIIYFALSGYKCLQTVLLFKINWLGIKNNLTKVCNGMLMMYI